MQPRANPTPARLSIPDAEAMYEFGRDLAGRLRAGDLVVLTGPLGAGKTTLTRGLGAGLRVRGAVTSPTFVLARTHPSTIEGPPLVHVDAYRLSSAVELDDLDIDFAGSIVVVEWGRGMLDGITDSWLDIEIERPLGASEAVPADAADLDLDLDEPRTVTITPVGPRWAAEGEWPRAAGPSA
ncbi:tRNA (adenosine(37)-N6)-threonylcarbamoyltransferase complex ATPase subunit type 1 TsaE [Cryobacterium tagatosivorans]|uniref:tRNA threonylcarbamoyladenosine biosynthesis protein TsaE n=1 Tax=Cryobacterium tagatosivorans TaxID=1259199 RepID=A0A4R8UD10_9MICO|nr:tRNA (adenosine(37)-N6)-threonylcarbamoyltransferase complex ATPase subunit type 1 TsaE [Cryobacterium tagatosivorans]TFB48484.1 tRNA (adenosine(37)-N6)-threonylcarbamoyltransferase complex ATPase subunit type 1 TsaE [Cryobacterium tagatosivorans]